VTVMQTGRLYLLMIDVINSGIFLARKTVAWRVASRPDKIGFVKTGR